MTEIIEVDDDCNIFYDDGTMKTCPYRPHMTFQDCEPGYGNHGSCEKWNYYHRDEKKRVNAQSLRVQIKQREKELFDLKQEVSNLGHIIQGKVVIDPPNQYNCKTCHNGSCIFHPKWQRQKDFVAQIRAFTVLYGCLSWLPGNKEVTA